MSDEEALLEAIRKQPLEDTPRLAYADWLDDHGDDADKRRATYIRTAIKAANDYPKLSLLNRLALAEFTEAEQRALASIDKAHPEITPDRGFGGRAVLRAEEPPHTMSQVLEVGVASLARRARAHADQYPLTGLTFQASRSFSISDLDVVLDGMNVRALSPHLRHVGFPILANAYQHVLKNHKALKELTSLSLAGSSCDAVGYFSQNVGVFSALRELSFGNITGDIDRPTLRAIGHAIPQLEALDLSENGGLADLQQVFLAGDYCGNYQKLKALSLRGSGVDAVRSLGDVVDGALPELQSLDVSALSSTSIPMPMNFTDTLSKLPRLEALDVSDNMLGLAAPHSPVNPENFLAEIPPVTKKNLRYLNLSRTNAHGQATMRWFHRHASEWEKLEMLELIARVPAMEQNMVFEDLAAARFPSLRHLTLHADDAELFRKVLAEERVWEAQDPHRPIAMPALTHVNGKPLEEALRPRDPASKVNPAVINTSLAQAPGIHENQ